MKWTTLLCGMTALLLAGYSTSVCATPALYLPWPEGEQWICTQGNKATGEGDTHRPGTSIQYAWDFQRDSQRHGGGPYAFSAAAPGIVKRVEQTGDNGGWGTYIIIAHYDGTFARYAHAVEGSIIVEENKPVIQGQRLGTVGNTGLAIGPTGIHLHFQVEDADGQSMSASFVDGGIPQENWPYISQNEVPKDGNLIVLTEPTRAKVVVEGVGDGAPLVCFQEKTSPAVWNLPPGRYRVKFYQPWGWWLFPPDPQEVTVALGKETIVKANYNRGVAEWLMQELKARAAYPYRADTVMRLYNFLPIDQYVEEAVRNGVPLNSYDGDIRGILSNAIQNDPEAAARRREAIRQLYITHLLRVPSQQEIDGWFDTRLPIERIKEEMINSPEAQNLWVINPANYPDQARFDFIRDCVYGHFLGRPPDFQGMKSFYEAPLNFDQMINAEKGNGQDREGVKCSQERREIIDRIWHLYYPHRSYPDAHGNDDAKNGFESITTLTRSDLPWDEGDHYRGFGEQTTGIRQLLAGLEGEGNERREYRVTWPSLVSWKFSDGMITNQRYLPVWAKAQDPYYGVGHIEVFTQKEGETSKRSESYINGDGSPIIEGALHIDTLDHPHWHRGLDEGWHRISFIVRNRADSSIDGPWARENIPGPRFRIDRTPPETIQITPSVNTPANLDAIPINVFVDDKGGGEGGWFELYVSETTDGSIGGARQNHLLVHHTETRLTHPWKIDRSIFLDGTHRVFVVAADTAGNLYNPMVRDDQAVHPPVYVKLDTTPPFVEEFQIVETDDPRKVIVKVAVRDNFGPDNVKGFELRMSSILIGTSLQPQGEFLVDAEALKLDPGIYQFSVTAEDQAGNIGVFTSTEAIVVSKPASQIGLESADSSLPANGLATTALTATLLDDEGNVVITADQTITFTLTSGSESAVLVGDNPVMPKNGTAAITLQAAIKAGIVTIEATSGTLTKGVLDIPVIPVTKDFRLTAEPALLAANGTDTSALTVTILDMNGDKMEGATNKISFSVTGGIESVSLPDPSTVNAVDGAAILILTATTTPGQAAIKVEVEGLGEDAISIQIVGASLNGQATHYLDGTALADVVVEALIGGNVKTAAVTGEDGRYALTDLKSGTYDLIARREGYVPALESGISVEASIVGAEQNFALAAQPQTVEGWDLVTVPFNFVDPWVVTALGDKMRVATYNGHGFNFRGLEVKPGLGFWVKPDPDRFHIVAPGNLAPQDQEQVIPLSAEGDGWNLIGSPFLSPVDLLYPYAWGYDPINRAYRLVDGTGLMLGIDVRDTQLQPWRGYWVRASEPVSLIVPPPGQEKGRNRREETRKTADSQHWTLQLVAQTGSCRDADNYLGIDASRKTPLTVESPPPIRPSVDLSFRNERTGEREAIDLRTSTNLPQIWDFIVETDMPDEEVVLTWPNLRQVPSDAQLTLEDMETGERIPLRTRTAYRFRSSNRRFRLEATRRTASLAITNLTAQPTRGGAVTITFTLSRPTDTRVRVISLAGRELVELSALSSRSVGLQTVSWDGRDSQGRPLPNGVYLLEVMAVDPEDQDSCPSRVTRAVRR